VCEIEGERDRAESGERERRQRGRGRWRREEAQSWRAALRERREGEKTEERAG